MKNSKLAFLVKQLIDNEVNITITPSKDDDGEIYFNYSGCYYDNNTRFRLHIF